MNRIHRPTVLFAFVFFSLTCAAHADLVDVGALSYDTFIAASAVAPGVDAFDIANLTGAYSLPPDFPVADGLMFQSAVLTLTLSDSSQEIFNLGDIAPGFLLDAGGNPVVQVSTDAMFNSTELTATLAPTTFALFDGTSFAASPTALDVLLVPSAGVTLQADVDQITIAVTGSVSTAPEPSLILLIAIGLMSFASLKGLRVWRQR